MDESLNDTIDLKDEVDEFEDLDNLDGLLGPGSVTVAAERRHTGAIEWALMGIANAIWAVAGLVLWLPQVTRAVLGAVLRTIHSALTQQSSGRAVAGIKRVSRSYVERFLHRQSEQVWVGRRHELRPFRLVAEAGWIVLFYLVLLRWLAPGRFGPVWQRLVEWTSTAGGWTASAATTLKGWLMPDLAAFDATRLQVTGILLLASFVGVGLGFWLGRRGR